MTRIMLNWLVCCLLSLALGGCAAGDMLGGGSMSASIPADILEEDAQTHRELFVRPVVQACLGRQRNSSERRSCRDSITFARMRYADIAFERYRHRLFYGFAGSNAVVDIAVLGLNAAGTLVPAAATKSILAAISGGLVGTRAIVEKEILQNAAIPMLILKMEEQRAAVRKRIEDRLKQDELVYSFEAAEIDAGDYFRAGTMHNALIALQGESATALSEQRRRIDEPQTAPIAWHTPPPSAGPAPPAAAAAPAPLPAAAAPAPARPKDPVHLGPLPANVHAALVKLIDFIRFQATKPQLDQVIAVLGLGPGSDTERIRAAISNRVTDPAHAEQQMKALSDLLVPALRRSFWP